MFTNKIKTCLWFDGKAEEAANYYVSIFKNSRIIGIQRYTEAGHDVHGQPAGSVLTVDFELNGYPFLALNGGPHFKFNEAISFQVMCEDQAEVDYYWEKLGDGGDESKRECGWLADKFGMSWQVVPTILPKLLGGPDRQGADRAMVEMMKMKKLDIGALQRAYDG